MLHSEQTQCFVSAMCAVRLAVSGTGALHISQRGGGASEGFGEAMFLFSEERDLGLLVEGFETGICGGG